MNELITTSLEWSNKLKESGWPQEGCIVYWVNGEEIGLTGWQTAIMEDYKEQVASPQAEEILQTLPNATITKGKLWSVTCDGVTFEDRWLADAAAALYCHLKK